MEVSGAGYQGQKHNAYNLGSGGGGEQQYERRRLSRLASPKQMNKQKSSVKLCSQMCTSGDKRSRGVCNYGDVWLGSLFKKEHVYQM